MPRIVTPDLQGVDVRIAELARRQGGVVNYQQLVDAGLRPSTIVKRAHAGRYDRRHMRLYSLGVGELSRRGELFAVLLAAPRGARLTGRTALELRGVKVAGSGGIAVVVDRRWRGVPGCRVIESKTMTRSDHASVRGLATTSVARAVLDLALDLDVDVLGKALHELDFRRLLVTRHVDQVLARNPGHPGLGRLREAMRRRAAGDAGTWSEFERRGHALLARADAARPGRNVLVPVEHGDPIRVDAYYATERLCIEFDPDHHLRPRTRRGDADRDVLLDASGYERLRFTGDDVERNGDRVVATVQATLARLRHATRQE